MNRLLIAVCLVSSAYGLPGAAGTCGECVKYLDTLVKDAVDQLPTLTAEDARTACSALPANLRDVCLSVIGSGLSKSDVTSLRNIDKRHLADLCTMIGSCKANKGQKQSLNPLVFHGDIIPTNRSLEVGGFPCIICRSVFGFLQRFLSNPSNEHLVLGLLEDACNLIPFLGHECSALVQEYGHILIQLMDHYLSPQMCTTFGLCPRVQGFSINECQVCQFAIGVLFDTVHDPVLKKRVTLSTKYVCSYLELEEKLCEELLTLSKYVPGIVSFMESHARFWSFCQATSMCFTENTVGVKSDARANRDPLMDVL